MNRIKGLRVMAGLKQEDVAEKFGITTQAYSKKERGVTSFTDNEKIIFRQLISSVDPDETVGSIFFNETKTK